MLKHSIAGACTTVLVALVGGLFTPTGSHAAVYGGVFDPEDNKYRWEGTHRFEVSESCLLSDGWRAANTGYGGYSFQIGAPLPDPSGVTGNYNADPCDAQLLGGSLSVKRKTGLDQGFKTLNFGTFAKSNVWGVFIKNGQLAGVDTYLTGPLHFTYAEEGDLFDERFSEGGGLLLRWESGRAPLNFVPGTLFNGVGSAPNVPSNTNYDQSLVDPVYLYRSLGNSDNYKELTPGQSARDVTFTRLGGPGQMVPEPGSLALVGLALAAAAGLSRSRLTSS